MSLTTWRQFQFFEVTPIKDPQLGSANPLYSDPTLSAAAPCGKGQLVLALKSTIITLFNFATSEVVHSFQAVPSDYHINYLKTIQNWLVAIAECNGKPTLIKIWSLKKNLPKDHTSYLTQVEIKNGSNTYPMSTVSISDDLSCIVTGFINGKVILIRGDLVRDRGSRQRIIYDDPSHEPITSLILNDLATTCFVATTSSTFLLSTSGRNNGKPELILNKSQGVDLHCSTCSKASGEFIGCYNDGSLNFYKESGELRKLQCDFKNIKRLFSIDKQHLLLLTEINSNSASNPTSNGLANANTIRATVTATNNNNTHSNRLIIMDIENNVISLNIFIPSTIIDIFFLDNKHLFLLTADGTIFNIVKKPIKEQLEITMQKELFPFTLQLASKFGIDKMQVQQIHKRFGDYLFDKKNNKDSAIKQYVQCLDVVDISEMISKIGIQDFSNPDIMRNLSDYLWALLKDNKSNSDHITLLLISLIKLKSVDEIDYFIEHFTRSGEFSEEGLNIDSDINDEAYFYSNKNLFDLDLILTSLIDSNYHLQSYKLSKKFSKDPNTLVDILLNTMDNPMEALNYIKTLSIDDTLRVIVTWSKQLLERLPNATNALLIDVFTGNYKPTKLTDNISNENQLDKHDHGNNQSESIKRASTTDTFNDKNNVFYSYNTFVSYMNKKMGIETDDSTLIQRDPNLTTYHPPKPSLVFNSFIKQPFEFVVFLEACLESYRTYEGAAEDKQIIYTTLYDLYLSLVKDDPQRKDDWHSKAINILKESNKLVISTKNSSQDNKNKKAPSQSNEMDNSLMMLISHMNDVDLFNLSEDASTLTGNKDLESIFRSMILLEEPSKCLQFLIKHCEEEPSLFTVALPFFISSTEILEKMGGESVLEEKIIKPILNKRLLSVLDIIQILSETDAVTFGIIQDLLINYVNEEESEFKKSEKLIKSYEDELDEKRKKLASLTQDETPTQIRIKNETCRMCHSSLDLPIVFFRCNHIYHQKCLNEETNFKDGEKLFRCPKCVIDLQTSQKLVSTQNEIANQSKILETILNNTSKNGDRFKVITDFIGRGGLEYSQVQI
ncbi:hypothetical protein TBLA_0B03370 [Henningerozyma blattae CBS 6284]|uniref:E3 ubiquitin-protein ligase PEP5 n=1 Tax=Henningerozyma blattae (strain ATCC 34711 / CBS 6284 / DSM 70876 / NBRC 10599 / NRRL Y-10934 / UCD 77-7) TaxID=1071380 RepID=I2GYH6_HENB6|nr:hypothetical protein TBLA_0B03370 [Tetrapisispora blattae CBS 6284]CCH59178.1 hypothetical protein TBLA_0B03370 [Tetrapisispora blattae CBS 6284]